MSKSGVSWLLFVVAGLVGTGLPLAASPQLPAWCRGLIVGYVAWSLFWGAPVVWRRRRAILEWIDRRFTHGSGVVRWAVGISFLLTAVYMYSVLGGGLYHFVQYTRSGLGPTPRRSLGALLASRRFWFR